jgi:proton glutamate symport protein
MSLTTRVVVALVAGLGLGIAVSASGVPALAAIATAVEPVGTVFVNAIRMTVVPLVVANLLVGVASAPDARAVGRFGGRALALFLVALAVAAAFALLVGPPMLGVVPLSARATAGLRASASASAMGPATTALPGAAQWLVDLVPANPIKAAADGAMLPLIVFTLAFGLALNSLRAERRAPVVAFFGAVADASLTLVRWVLAAAPVGVFALALPLATRLGAQAASAVASYVVVVSVATTVFTVLVLYPAAIVLGRVRPTTLARAWLPAQVVAFSSRSSLASLPAMIAASRDRLGLPEPVTSFVLPLAASTFRVAGALGQTIGVLFVARLYGVELDAARMVAVAATVIVTTFSIPGVPAGSVLASVPALIAGGVPVAGVGILIALDAIPDMFRTTANVTGDLVVATIVARAEQDST